jgi:ribosomal-protein-alanine N-acetyltransferase
LLDESWATHTRILSSQIQVRLDEYVSYVAEVPVGLRGLLMVEPQPPGSSLMIAAAVHDHTRVLPVLEALLTPVEAVLREQQIESIMQIGEAAWLTRELPHLGFRVTNQIITFEWYRQPLPAIRPYPGLRIRSAQLNDLPDLLTLDQLAFGPMWNKPRTTFRDALSRAATFTVGLIDDRIIAYEWADQFGDHAHLTRLAIHPDYQGVGIGTQLLHHALGQLVELEIKLVTLNTQQDNLRSQELYQRFSFHKTNQAVGVYVKTLAA